MMLQMKQFSWSERWNHNPNVGGSNPSFIIKSPKFYDNQFIFLFFLFCFDSQCFNDYSQSKFNILCSVFGIKFCFFIQYFILVGVRIYFIDFYNNLCWSHSRFVPICSHDVRCKNSLFGKRFFKVFSIWQFYWYCFFD